MSNNRLTDEIALDPLLIRILTFTEPMHPSIRRRSVEEIGPIAESESAKGETAEVEDVGVVSGVVLVLFTSGSGLDPTEGGVWFWFFRFFTFLGLRGVGESSGISNQEVGGSRKGSRDLVGDTGSEVR